MMRECLRGVRAVLRVRNQKILKLTKEKKRRIKMIITMSS
jgi:hypothetical protein